MLFTSVAMSKTILELRCPYTVVGTKKILQTYKDPISGLSKGNDINKKEEINDSAIDYIKITFGDYNYFRFESGKTIYSTSMEENIFNGWNKEEMSVTFTNLTDSNTISLRAQMGTEKYGQMQIMQRITIDRVSGKYEVVETKNDTWGKPKKDDVVFKQVFTNTYMKSIGVCEKFSRKF